MKKVIYFFIGMLISTFSLNAQLKVQSSGNTIIGDITQTATSLLELSGSTKSMEISNSNETEAGIIFYDRGYESSQYAKFYSIVMEMI